MISNILVFIKIVGGSTLMIPLLLGELVLWIWIKMISLFAGNPEAITFKTKAKGADTVVKKAAQGLRWVFSIVKKYAGKLRCLLWREVKDQVKQNFPEFHRRCQRIYNFFSGP